MWVQTWDGKLRPALRIWKAGAERGGGLHGGEAAGKGVEEGEDGAGREAGRILLCGPWRPPGTQRERLGGCVLMLPVLQLPLPQGRVTQALCSSD